MGRAVTPLEQAGAGGVQVQNGLVFHNGELNLIQRAVLRHPILMIPGGQPIRYGFFDDFLAVRHGVQGAVQTVSLHREGAVLGDHPLPGNGFGAFKQLVEGLCGKPPHHQQHPLAESAAQVGPGHAGLIRFKIDSAVFRADIGHVHMSQFISYQALQAKQAGNTKFQFQKIRSFPSFIGTIYLSSLKNSSK